MKKSIKNKKIMFQNHYLFEQLKCGQKTHLWRGFYSQDLRTLFDRNGKNKQSSNLCCFHHILAYLNGFGQ